MDLHRAGGPVPHTSRGRSRGKVWLWEPFPRPWVELGENQWGGGEGCLYGNALQLRAGVPTGLLVVQPTSLCPVQGQG